MSSPDRIGDYELLRPLGRGGMAETFAARRVGPGDFVQACCVKCVLPQLAEDADFRDQFLDEAAIHGRLQHSNIVHVLDFGEHDGRYFLALELVEGVDLAQLLHHGDGGNGDGGGGGSPLAVELAVLVAIDLCHALAYAHALTGDGGALRIVHRDLTPSNVLLSVAGEVKLSDFGIARSVDRRHRTQTGFTKGKFCYMSPEQIEADAQLDGRSDLFALGVLLYEMLSGSRPFEGAGGNDLSVLPRILNGDYEPLDERVPGLSTELVELVSDLLSVRREQRPPSATAVLERLAPLTPPATARARLASDVRSRMRPTPDSGPVRTEHVVQPANAFTATLPAAEGAATRTAVPRARPRAQAATGRAWLILGLSLCVAGIVAVAAMRRSGPDTAEARAPAARPAAESAPVLAASAPLPPKGDGLRSDQEPGHGGEARVAPAPEPGSRDRAGARAASVESAESAESLEDVRLRVVVVPFGTIWIDGKRAGDTRVSRRVSAGKHRIGIGRGERPSQTYDVQLSAGARTLEYELPDSFD